jgi:hypothetical protein
VRGVKIIDGIYVKYVNIIADQKLYSGEVFHKAPEVRKPVSLEFWAGILKW